MENKTSELGDHQNLGNGCYGCTLCLGIFILFWGINGVFIAKDQPDGALFYMGLIFTLIPLVFYFVPKYLKNHRAQQEAELRRKRAQVTTPEFQDHFRQLLHTQGKFSITEFANSIALEPNTLRFLIYQLVGGNRINGTLERDNNAPVGDKDKIPNLDATFGDIYFAPDGDKNKISNLDATFGNIYFAPVGDVEQFIQTLVQTIMKL